MATLIPVGLQWVEESGMGVLSVEEEAARDVPVDGRADDTIGSLPDDGVYLVFGSLESDGEPRSAESLGRDTTGRAKTNHCRILRVSYSFPYTQPVQRDSPLNLTLLGSAAAFFEGVLPTA
jgi:hypothetical protein